MKNNINCLSTFFVLIAILVFPVLSADAETDTVRMVNLEQKRQTISALVKMIRERYAISENAEKAARSLERSLTEGKYHKISNAQDFANVITADIQKITGDKHFRFGLEPLPQPQSASIATAKILSKEEERAAWLAEMRRGNYGFLKLEIMAGNVGYLDFRRFQPPDLSGNTLVGVMAFLANADAIIIDLRKCHGGSAYMTEYLAGYFFPKATHLFDMEFRGDNYIDHFWTIAYLPGKRLSEVPVYVLTSAYTFSGAEGFAYRFKVLKRATIVGETTEGGANAGGVLNVAPFFRVYMPMGRPVDPDTGTNWEGTGVEPDIKTTAKEALIVAHLEALKLLKSKALKKDDQDRLDWEIERVRQPALTRLVSAETNSCVLRVTLKEVLFM